MAEHTGIALHFTESVKKMYADSGRGMDESEQRAYLTGIPTKLLLIEIARRHEQMESLFESPLHDGVMEKLKDVAGIMASLETQVDTIFKVVTKVKESLNNDLREVSKDSGRVVCTESTEE